MLEIPAFEEAVTAVGSPSWTSQFLALTIQIAELERLNADEQAVPNEATRLLKTITAKHPTNKLVVAERNSNRFSRHLSSLEEYGKSARESRFLLAHACNNVIPMDSPESTDMGESRLRT